MKLYMSPDEIEAALEAAFNWCDAANCPLTDTQKYILLQAIGEIKEKDNSSALNVANPLDELKKEELEVFLEFVKEQQEQNRSWKVQLLNDWLRESDSGSVQFLRDRYGLQWLSRVEPIHFNQYAFENILKLKVGDRIEVCNRMWEWVQENGPCSSEWFPCTVINLNEVRSDDFFVTNCIVRFSNGAEYEIQGIYEWNRYNWRWGE